jgi:lysozyme
LYGNASDSSKYPILGVDISHHQGSIDWNELKKDTLVQFVFMKATEGGDFKDTKFQYNWKEAKRVGIRRGAYHFYSFCRTGQMQAQNFIASVPYDTNALPPVIDLEFLGSCKNRPSLDEAIREIKACLQALENHYHKKPVLYTTYDFYETYLQHDLLDYDLWIRDVYGEPTHQTRAWTFWQFSNTGFRKGIKGKIDLNAFVGNISEFEKY